MDITNIKTREIVFSMSEIGNMKHKEYLEAQRKPQACS